MSKLCSLAIFHFLLIEQLSHCLVDCKHMIMFFVGSYHIPLLLFKMIIEVLFERGNLFVKREKIFIIKSCSSKSDPSLWISTNASCSKVRALPMERSPHGALSPAVLSQLVHISSKPPHRQHHAQGKIDATLSWVVSSMDPKTMNSERCSKLSLARRHSFVLGFI